MGDQDNIWWWDVIVRWNEEFGPDHQDREKQLRSIIERYGIDFRDRGGRVLVEYAEKVYRMVEHDIDVIYEYSPSICVWQNGLLHWPYMDVNDWDHVMNYIDRILNNDKQGVYVRYKQDCKNYRERILETKFEEYVRYRDECMGLEEVRIQAHYMVNYKMIDACWERLNTHRNRHFTMFEHFIHFLDQKDTSKKQRF